MSKASTRWYQIVPLPLFLFFLLLPTSGFPESLKDGVILRDDAKVFLRNGTTVSCSRIVWLVTAADFVQCDKGDHAVEIKLEDLNFGKTFGEALAREYAAMKGDLAREHEKSRQEQEANTVTYGAFRAQEPAEGPGEQPETDSADPAVLPEAAAEGDDKGGKEPENLEDALKALRTAESPVKAYNAARAIAGLARDGGDCTRAVDLLIEHLKDERPVMMLSMGGGVSSGGATKRSVGDAAKYALVSIGSPSVPALIDQVKQIQPASGEESDKRAIVALGEIGDTRAVQALTRHAEQRQRPFSRDAVRSLARIQGPAAWDGLVTVLRSREGRVRLEAGWCLHKMDKARAGAAIDPYIDAMLTDSDSKNKRSAINLAGSCGLKRLAPDFVRFLNHPDSMVIWMALGALAKVGAPGYALPRLMALAEEEKQNDSATRAIRTISDPEALDGLIGGLGHEDWKVREASAWALGEIGYREAVPALAAALVHEDRRTRFAALEALGKIPGAAADEAIRSAAASEDAKFSMRARGLLKGRP